MMILRFLLGKAAKLVKAFAIIALVLVVATSLSGCSGGSSSSASTVPGAYGVDPRGVSTDGVQASDVAVVAAPCQGQAFRIPDAAFAYVKTAIDGEGYVSLTRADTASVVGKSYALTSSSQSARADEMEANEFEFFGYAYNARAEADGVLLLESMNAAVGDLSAKASGADKVLVVVSSGVTGGLLGTTAELLAMDPADVVAQLQAMSAIADYSGVSVVFYGLGQSTGDQEISASAAAKIKSLMTAVVEAGGGCATVATDALVALGCDDVLPAVDVVDLGVDAISIPELAVGQTAEVSLSEAELSFVANSAEFADAAQAQTVLAALAAQIIEGGYVVDAVGHTADVGGGANDGQALSYARAQAVADALVNLGVPASQIGQITGVGCSESTSFAGGVFDEAQAKLDRKVVVTAHA